MKINWKFLGGGECKTKNLVGGVSIFSGTAGCGKGSVISIKSYESKHSELK